MLKTWRNPLRFFLALEMLVICPGQATNGSNPHGRSDQHTARVKEAVAAIGTGQDEHIQVELKDKKRITGVITAIHEDDFVVTDSESNAPVTIAYANVKRGDKPLWLVRQ